MTTPVSQTLSHDVNNDGELDVITASFDGAAISATVKYNLGEVTDKMGTRPHYSAAQNAGSSTTGSLKIDGAALVYNADEGTFAIK